MWVGGRVGRGWAGPPTTSPPPPGRGGDVVRYRGLVPNPPRGVTKQSPACDGRSLAKPPAPFPSTQPMRSGTTHRSASASPGTAKWSGGGCTSGRWCPPRRTSSPGPYVPPLASVPAAAPARAPVRFSVTRCCMRSCAVGLHCRGTRQCRDIRRRRASRSARAVHRFGRLTKHSQSSP